MLPAAAGPGFGQAVELAGAGHAGDTRGVAALRVASNLERIADLATNVGESIISMEEGRARKHHREEEP